MDRHYFQLNFVKKVQSYHSWNLQLDDNFRKKSNVLKINNEEEFQNNKNLKYLPSFTPISNKFLAFSS